ncbi:helix-turn-helix transcriptional regulator [Candidatus Saccharibacteria bacterium]|nr:helix-turn-helix transcriptional regulator [Candidatus Saccharibacteria bacterium]
MDGMKDRIRAILTARNIKAVEFARQLQTSKANVSCWLSGRVEPSAATRAHICAVFNVSREWLEKGSGEMDAPRDPTLSAATFEEIQLAYIRALLNRLPEAIQARVMSVIGHYVEEKRKREIAAEKEREQEELEEQIEAAAQESRRLIEEEEEAAEKARRAYWRSKYNETVNKRQAEFKAARENGTARRYVSRVYDNVGAVDCNVENMSVIQQSPAPVQPPAQVVAPPKKPSANASGGNVEKTSETAEFDAMIARLSELRDRRRRELGIDNENNDPTRI